MLPPHRGTVDSDIEGMRECPAMATGINGLVQIQ